MALFKCLTCIVRNSKQYEKIIIPVISPSFFEKDARSSRNFSSKHDSSSSSSSESDVETKKKKLRGQTDFWQQKMRTHHMAIDLNNDGVVSWDDFEQLIKNFEALGNLSPEEVDNLTDALKHVWEDEWGASTDPYAFIGYETFLKNMQHAVNSKNLRKKLAGPLPYFFNAVDWNNSGDISIEEYKTFFKCLNLPEESAIEAFQAVDINKDGSLSKKEFVKFGTEFFLTEDETRPSKMFWGPLAE